MLIAVIMGLSLIMGFLAIWIEAKVFYIFLAIIGLIVIVINPYLAIYAILLLQPIAFLGSDVGIGIAKLAYGALFAFWFIAWFLSYVLNKDPRNSLLWHPVTVPALLFGFILVMAILNGVAHGTDFGENIRDLSPYLGYLAVLPVMFTVTRYQQARKIIIFFAVIGLPSYLLFNLTAIGSKQGVEEYSKLGFIPYAAHYWGPIQGAFWAVALAADKMYKKVAGWVWILFTAGVTVASGFRGLLLSFIIGAGVAFLASGKLGRHNVARFMVPVFLTMMIMGVLADQSGIIKLPISSASHDSYTSLLSSKKFESDQSMDGRLREIQALYEAWSRNYVLGIGFGHHLKFRWVDDNMRTMAWFKYHNGYLETLMKFGILGAIILAWYFFAVLRLAYRVIGTADTFFCKAIGLGTVIWLISGFFYCVANSLFADRGFALTTGIIAGLLPALANQHPMTESIEEPAVMKVKETLVVPSTHG